MFYYQVGYGSWEDSGVVWLMHKRSFRQYQFKKMLFDCAIECAKKYHADEVESYDKLNADYISEGDSDDAVYDETSVDISWRDIYKQSADLMCEKYGFKKPQIKAEWFGSGWYNMLNKFDMKHNCPKDRFHSKMARKLQELFVYVDPWNKRVARRKRRERRKQMEELSTQLSTLTEGSENE